jgi:hypothetical protein
MKQVSVVCLLLIVSCSTVLLAQNPVKDPRIGNWKLNVAKSTYPAGTTAPQMSSRTYATRPDGYFVIIQVTVGAQGNAFFNEGVFKIDGKPYPATTLPILLTSLLLARNRVPLPSNCSILIPWKSPFGTTRGKLLPSRQTPYPKTARV